MSTSTKKPMSDDHKEALAVGRTESRAVRAYLEALETHRPRRGRKRTKDSITSRLDAIATELADADSLKRLQLTQEELDLRGELAAMDDGVDLGDLESEFVKVAKSYAQRKGISYTAFRQVGVSAATLKEAGISRGD
ncbi:MAG: hypothetical protein AAF467_15930 [Actinomycetota bacterium]